MTDITVITDDNFETEITNSDQLVLIDFWAEWCGPCKQLMPTLQDLASDKEVKVKICKMNIDENPNRPTKYGVRSIPTLMIFKKGELVSTKVGVLSRSAIIDWIKEYAK